MKKNILLSAISTLLFVPIFAQSPGGVSGASTNQLWLDANQLTLSNGSFVSNWIDKSGKGNDAKAQYSYNMPIFKTNMINGLPAIQFNGVDDRLKTGAISALNTNKITSFAVFTSDDTDPGVLYRYAYATGGGDSYLSQFIYGQYYTPASSELTYIVRNASSTPPPQKINKTSFTGSLNISSLVWDGSTSLKGYYNGSLVGSIAGSNSNPGGNLGIGIGANFKDAPNYMKCLIAEKITYSKALSSAEVNIVENYLAAKYNISIANDKYAFEATARFDVIGIGQESDGSNLSAKGLSTLGLSVASLANGDYILAGHNNAGYAPNTTDVPVGLTRFNQVWRADVSGAPGLITVTYDVTTYGLGQTGTYKLLVDGDGVFATGATSYNGVYSSGIVTFSSVSMPVGSYFTLANSNGVVNSTNVTTDWHTTTTWDCGCVPVAGMTVNILTGHVVDINGQNAAAGTLTVDGTLTFSGATDTLSVLGNLTNNNVFTVGTGSLLLNGASSQTLTGNFALNNLIINNSSGVTNSGILSIAAGGYLDVISGSLTTGNNLTFISNTSGTGALKNPSTGTIIGNVTVQRYLNEGDSWYLLASPLTNATIEDWNNEIEMQGFLGTEWPTASSSSVYYYTEALTGPTTDEGYQIPTNTSNITTNTVGYDIYVATDGLGSIPRTIDQTGTPKLGDGIVINGTYTTNIGDPTQDGWNLVGNPYQSPVKYANVAKGGSYDVAYRKKASGAQVAINGVDMVSPGEGFWLHCLGGPCSLTFDAVDVNTTNIDQYNLRTTQENTQMVIKLNYDNDYDEVLLGFDENATNNYDLGLDGYKLNNSFNYKPNLAILNSENHNQYIGMFNQDFNDVLPLKIYTENPSGVEKKYSLSFENVSYIKERNKHLVLEDRLLNTFTSVTEGLTVDVVMNDNVSEPRFFLHVSTPLITQKTDVTCYNQNNGKITLELDGSETVDVICYDELMNVVDTRNQVNTTQNITNLQPGTYKLEVLNTSFGNVSNLISITEPLAIASAFDLTITNQIENGYTSSSTVDTFNVVQHQLLDFSNVSENTTNYTWDFGDMITSNLESPQHIYFNTGLYKVTLTSKNGACESESYKYVQVDGTTSILETNLLDNINVLVKENNLYVYLNNQIGDKNVSFEVLNQLGQTVFSTVKNVETNHVEKVSLPHASGIYLVKIDGFNYSKTKKIVLN